MIANQKPDGSSRGNDPSKNGKKLLDRALDALLAEGFAEPVARRYVSWMREYILFHNKRHPQEMGVPEVRAFLEDARFSSQSGRRVEATAAIRFLYGSGLRIKECCRLRVKDVDPERLQLAVRNGKGDQDRATVLPRRLVDRLREQVERVRRLHEDDLAIGSGRVWLPPALRRKYPNAERELGWQ